jgi:hypothetical protein
MKTKSLEFSKNPDLRTSLVAMRRAALRARQIAASTGTRLVLAYNGKWILVAPGSAEEGTVIPTTKRPPAL